MRTETEISVETPYPILVQAMGGGELTLDDARRLCQRIDREVQLSSVAGSDRACRRQAVVAALAFFAPDLGRSLRV